MEKLLIHRTADVSETMNDYPTINGDYARHNSCSDPEQGRIHVENANEFGRRYRGKYNYSINN